MKHIDKTLVENRNKGLVTRRKIKILKIEQNFVKRERNKEYQKITEAAARVVIVRSTATGASVGSTADVWLRRGSRSMAPPPFCKA